MTNEARIERAVALFKSGFNCSQAVVAAFADLYGFTDEQAFKMAASFGGGIGRMRQTCGAACGMFLLAGLDTGATEGSDNEGKSYNYKVVQALAEKFRQENGSLISRILQEASLCLDGGNCRTHLCGIFGSKECIIPTLLA